MQSHIKLTDPEYRQLLALVNEFRSHENRVPYLRWETAPLFATAAKTRGFDATQARREEIAEGLDAWHEHRLIEQINKAFKARGLTTRIRSVLAYNGASFVRTIEADTTRNGRLKIKLEVNETRPSVTLKAAVRAVRKGRPFTTLLNGQPGRNAQSLGIGPVIIN